MFDVPVAIVSVVDADRIWFKSHHGIDFDEIPRDDGLCASAILQDGPSVVTDAPRDPRALSNHLVAGEFGLRFYAGVPLKTSGGHNLGTLCVLDFNPREFAPEEAGTLEDLAGMVVSELELRLARRRASVAAHEREILSEAFIGMLSTRSGRRPRSSTRPRRFSPRTPIPRAERVGAGAVRRHHE